MMIVGQSLRFPGVLRAPMGVHIRFYGVFAEPEDEEPIGLDQRAIERIPVLTYRKSSSRRTSDDDKCAVCLSEFQNGDKVKRLKCKHYFHVDCIDPWLKVNRVDERKEDFHSFRSRRQLFVPFAVVNRNKWIFYFTFLFFCLFK